MKRKGKCKYGGKMQNGGEQGAPVDPVPQQKDPWADFLLMRNGTLGLTELSGITDRNRQDQYMYNQMSTLGQMNPMPVNDYQPNPYNLYMRMGGNLKHYQFGGFPMARKMKNVNFYGMPMMQQSPIPMMTPEQNQDLGMIVAQNDPNLSFINDKLLKTLRQGGIHIKKENRGKFTASANRAGMGVQEFASHVLANKDQYSSTQVKRANFARNASKWH